MRITLGELENQLLTVHRIVGALNIAELKYTTSAVIMGEVKNWHVMVTVDVQDPFLVGQLVAVRSVYGGKAVLEYRKEFPSILARNGGFIIRKARQGHGEAVRSAV